ncbi:MAG: S53 family peptidase [Acidibacillus sp.]|nr:S53 family peptidase [Acidibacillus sp.]
MKWKIRMTMLAAGFLCATALPAYAASTGAQGNVTTMTALPGSTEPFLTHATLIGVHDPNSTMSITVALHLQNQIQLQSLLHDQYTKGSSEYHQWLKPGEFTSKFGPSVAQYQTVMNYLQSSGLHIQKTYANRMLIDVTGNTKNIEQTFGVQIGNYKVGSKNFYAPQSSVKLPTQVSSLISAVIGLSNYHQMHTHLIMKQTATAHQLTATSGYTPSQIETAYNYNPLYNEGINGSGVTIGILTADTYNSSDIATFDQAYGLPTPSVTDVNVDGTPSQINPETTLDLEWSSATAPGANVIMYEGANSSLGTFTDVYNAAASADAAQVLSTSWGTAESNMSQSELTADDNIFSQMASQGQSVFVASGDNGATDGTSNLAVDYPSSDPYVTACGGTKLILNSNDTIQSETGWSGSGGGQSSVWSEPSWQTGENVPQDGQRQTPDIALNADPNTGYSFYYNGAWNVAGGTSFVAPQMTATFALIDQDLAYQGYSSIGEADPNIYQDAAYNYNTDFNQITSGNNGYYSCGPGYNNVTGWGSINATNFVNDLG